MCLQECTESDNCCRVGNKNVKLSIVLSRSLCYAYSFAFVCVLIVLVKLQICFTFNSLQSTNYKLEQRSRL